MHNDLLADQSLQWFLKYAKYHTHVKKSAKMLENLSQTVIKIADVHSFTFQNPLGRSEAKRAFASYQMFWVFGGLKGGWLSPTSIILAKVGVSTLNRDHNLVWVRLLPYSDMQMFPSKITYRDRMVLSDPSYLKMSRECPPFDCRMLFLSMQ